MGSNGQSEPDSRILFMIGQLQWWRNNGSNISTGRNSEPGLSIEFGQWRIKFWILFPCCLSIDILWKLASWVSSNRNGGRDGVGISLLIIFDIVGRNHSGVSGM